MYKSLSDLPTSEILAVTIRESPEIASQLLSQFSLKDLATAAPEELQKSGIKGIGPVKSRQILFALELGKRLYTLPPEERPIISTPEDAANLVMAEMRYLSQEHFKVIALNTKHHVLAIDTLGIGTANSCQVSPADCLRIALKRGSQAIICIHNHPSTDPNPSLEDQELTKRLVEAGKLIGVTVLDHLIIGGNKFVSLKEQGLI